MLRTKIKLTPPPPTGTKQLSNNVRKPLRAKIIDFARLFIFDIIKL